MIVLDLKDKRPLYEQVAEQLKEQMSIGILEENARLPSAKGMAVDLSINPNTVQRAYAQLEREGYVYSLQGQGLFVTRTARLHELCLTELKERLLQVLKEARRMGLSDEEILALVSKSAREMEKDTGVKTV